jgi:hypothetical protein
MLERLRIQEISQIVFSVPEGAVIGDTGLTRGEPVMIINNPGTSELSFIDFTKKNNDRGFISTSGQTNSLTFVINDGAILYSVWSYLHGIYQDNQTVTLRGTEWLEDFVDEKYLKLGATPKELILYEEINDTIKKLTTDKYELVKDAEQNCYIHILEPKDTRYFVSYLYDVNDVQTTEIKQIHNNIFCSMDVFFEAMNMDNDEKHTVCIHCDKVQIFMDLAIAANQSEAAAFTPITVKSIPAQDDFNRTIATITVI